MATPRASIFEGDGDEIDISAFTPKPAPDRGAPPAKAVRAVAEAANFPSREASAAPAHAVKRTPRQYRTGRNVQFNVRATQETVDTFYAITDAQGWVLGETLARALAALQRELEGRGKGGAA